MSIWTRYVFAAAAAAFLLAACASPQQTAQKSDEPYHIRGTLTGVDGSTLTVTTDTGAVKTITLGEGAGLFTIDNAGIDDITAGKFVGITSIESGARRVALEVHVFDDALRGLAEGHYAWDLVAEPNMMTNASVGHVLGIGDERELMVTYFEGVEGAKTKGWQSIYVSPEADIVSFFPADASKLMLGEAIWVLATDTDEGIVAPAVVIGQNGIVPPF